MKKTLLNLITFVIILTLTIISFSTLALPSKLYADPSSYDIGDTGPAGGLIFYRDGSNYLEAAPSDQGIFSFSNITTQLIGTTSSSIGSGQANTNAIIAQAGHIASAAKICDDLVINGYSDWFLPSIDELELMHDNLHLSGLGDFYRGAWYCSSSEHSATLSWQVGFGTGMVKEWEKFRVGRVRAIRAFSITKEKEKEWVRTMPMTCWQVFINDDNMFEFIFWYPYKDNNWVRIYDIEGNMVYEGDVPVDDPLIIVDLPDGMYTVKTYHVGFEIPIQEFLIGKP